MNGSKHPIQDGDYLLLELVSPANAGSITGSTMAIERQDQTGDDQYLLRVVTKNRDGSYVLVANNKQGKAQDHRYLDHWIDDHTFHWQSQNATTPDSKRGREIIEHEKRGISLHLFVRDAKLAGGKAAPFVYHGAVRYRSHTGSAPMSVVFEVGWLVGEGVYVGAYGPVFGQWCRSILLGYMREE